MTDYSLFLGRFQPPHAGHVAIIQRLLDEGRVPVIAIRETAISKYNPWTYGERVETFRRILGSAYAKCKFMKMPDIDDVVYGRTPGWNIREIDVGKQVKDVSATIIREELLGKIVWLTGNSGAGKTTLADVLQLYIPNSIVLDGDEMRKSISIGAGFSMDQRLAHNETVARLAMIMAQRGHTVIVSVISPTKEIRHAVQGICYPLWVYVSRTQKTQKDRPYEPPEYPDVVVDNDLTNPEQGARLVMDALGYK